MTDSEDTAVDHDAAVAAPPGIGAQLRAARERKGMTLDQLAGETRISRHSLDLLEKGNFTALAGRTYAVGFAKTYAKVVGLDQNDVAAIVRAEIDEAAADAAYSPARGSFEPGDPTRSPGGGLLWFSMFAIVVLLVGIYFAARALFSPAAEMPSLIEQEEAQQAEAAASANSAATPAATGGAVVFTAQGETWVRFYEDGGTVLQEGMMQAGDSFTVPATARNPQINTGRPDLLTITVGGQEVPRLATGIETIQHVPISAEALLARPAATETAATEPGEAVETIGFGLGTAPRAQPVAARPTVRAPASPRPSASSTAEAVESAEPAPETPGPAATAPPRAIPAEPADDGASPEIN